jgi:hypothetical protein
LQRWNGFSLGDPRKYFLFGPIALGSKSWRRDCGARKLWAGMADYARACHLATHCADPVGSDPPCRLATKGMAIERFGSRDNEKLPNGSLFARAMRISAKSHRRIERMGTNRFFDKAENGCRGIGAAAHTMIAELGRLSRAGRAAGSCGLRLRLQSALRADRIRQRLDVSLSADELSGIPNHTGGRPRKKGHASLPRRNVSMTLEQLLS